VTASREPVLKGEWLKPGVHINAVGASVPSARELDTEVVKRSQVFVDRRESAMAEAGDLLIPVKEGAFSMDRIAGEIGELLIGKAKGRSSDSEITLFKSLGIAVEDLACAQWLYNTAKRKKVGKKVAF
jgi:alanine dehydrogenase